MAIQRHLPYLPRKEKQMNNLIVVDFEDTFKAKEARVNLLKKEKEPLSEIKDAVVVAKQPDSNVTIDHMAPLTVGEALGDSFLGNLIGSIFHQPEPGDHDPGTHHGALEDVGISDNSMKQFAQTLRPGHSMLFVLTRPGSAQKIVEELRDSGGKMVHPYLSGEQGRVSGPNL